MVSSFLFFHGVASRPAMIPAVSRPIRPLQRLHTYTEDTADFLQDLFDRAGLKLEDYRSSALQRRIPACLRLLRVPDLKAARAKLKARPELMADLVDVVLLGVTDFCRDQAVFDQLRDCVVPNLRRLAWPPRIWSAGCSEGRELYSIAMLLHEAALDEAELLGTDCRPAAIRAARDGVFPREALKNLPSAWQCHFHRSGNGLSIGEHLKRNVRWKRADLLSTVEPGPWDLVLWRNMAIYLHAEASQLIWDNLIQELSPGGFIVCGKADYAPGRSALEKVGRGIYHKKEQL
jgi:chemotaxis protein methyltransferase CheR